MADTIGRVQFIVGFDGRRLPAEARRIAKRIGKEGDKAGAEFGKEADEAAAREFGPRLTKAGDRAAKNLGKKGKLAGSTYAKNIEKAVVKIYRKMERETSDALASKEGFERFVKNAGSADAAILKLKSNVNELSKTVVKVGNKKISFFGDSDQEGWLTTIKRIEEFGAGALEAEKKAKVFQDRINETRLEVDKFRLSLDNDTFDRVAAKMGGAENAAKRYRERLAELAETGEITEIQFNRLTVAIDKHVNRTEKASQGEREHQADLMRAASAAADKAAKLKLLDERLAKLDSRMGDRKAFEKYVRSVGDVDRAGTRLGGFIRNIERMGILSARSIGTLQRRLGNLTDSFKESTDGAGGFFSKLSEGWSGMRTNGRQIIIITAAILSFGAALSALGSGAAAALTALISSLAIGLVGAAAAAGAAIAGLVWTISHAVAALEMMGDQFPPAKAGMDNLAAAAKSDSAAFARAWGPALADFTNRLAQLWRDDKMGERAGEALGKVTEAFTAVLESPSYKAFEEAMETTIPASIVNLGEGFAEVVEGLLQVFAVVGPFLEELTGKFEQWAADWNASIQEAAANGELQKFFELAMESIDALMGAFGALGGLLGTIFTAGAPAGNEMLGMLEELFDSLNEFLQSPEGQNQLQEWFDNGVELFKILLDLIGQIGGQFSDMITPEIMSDTFSALSNLGDGLQVIFDIMQILGGLDLFGNIVAAFEALSEFVTPLVDPLYEIADAVGNLLLEAFEAVTPILAAAGEVLAPIVEAIADIVTVVVDSLIPVFDALTPAIEAIVDAFTPVATLVADVVTKAFELLWPKIQVVIDFIIELIEAITPLIEEILPVVASLVEALSAVLEFLWPIIHVVSGIIMGALKIAFTIIIEVIEIVIDIISALIDAFGDVVDWVTDHLTPIFEEFGNFMDDIWNAISDSVDEAVSQILGFFRSIKKVVDDAIGWFNSLFGAANNATSAANNAGRSGGGTRPMAVGGVLFAPRRILAGEAGPEAIVPLNRPLSQVDPSVRTLSAFAQGLGTPGTGGGGTSRVVTIGEGAVQVFDSGNARQTAYDVLDVLANRIAG